MLSNAFPFGTCTNEEMDRFFHVLDEDDKATDIIVDRCYDCCSGDRGEVEQLDIARPSYEGIFCGCVVYARFLRRVCLSMYWESFTHLRLMRGWNR